jgi:hypothetical protein
MMDVLVPLDNSMTQMMVDVSGYYTKEDLQLCFQPQTCTKRIEYVSDHADG